MMVGFILLPKRRLRQYEVSIFRRREKQTATKEISLVYFMKTGIMKYPYIFKRNSSNKLLIRYLGLALKIYVKCH